jgi:hypothetical protein
VTGGAVDLSTVNLDLDFLTGTDPNGGDPFWAAPSHRWKIVDIAGTATLSNTLQGILAADLATYNVGGRTFSLSLGTVVGVDLNDIYLDYVNPVPEPATVGVLFGAACLGVGMLRRRRRSARA